MVELISGLILASIGYILGLFIGWGDGNKSSYRQRAATSAPSKKKEPLCQDYSHLKKKAIMKNLSRISLAHMPDKIVCDAEIVYDAEIVEYEIQVSKVV